MTQAQKSAKNENGIFGISASRGLRKVIICHIFGEKKIDQCLQSTGSACLTSSPAPAPHNGPTAHYHPCAPAACTNPLRPHRANAALHHQNVGPVMVMQCQPMSSAASVVCPAWVDEGRLSIGSGGKGYRGSVDQSEIFALLLTITRPSPSPWRPNRCRLHCAQFLKRIAAELPQNSIQKRFSSSTLTSLIFLASNFQSRAPRSQSSHISASKSAIPTLQYNCADRARDMLVHPLGGPRHNNGKAMSPAPLPTSGAARQNAALDRPKGHCAVRGEDTYPVHLDRLPPTNRMSSSWGNGCWNLRHRRIPHVPSGH